MGLTTVLKEYHFMTTVPSVSMPETNIMEVKGKGVMKVLNGATTGVRTSKGTFRLYIDEVLMWTGFNPGNMTQFGVGFSISGNSYGASYSYNFPFNSSCRVTFQLDSTTDANSGHIQVDAWGTFVLEA